MGKFYFKHIVRIKELDEEDYLNKLCAREGALPAGSKVVEFDAFLSKQDGSQEKIEVIIDSTQSEEILIAIVRILRLRRFDREFTVTFEPYHRGLHEYQRIMFDEVSYQSSINGSQDDESQVVFDKKGFAEFYFKNESSSDMDSKKPLSWVEEFRQEVEDRFPEAFQALDYVPRFRS